MGKRIRRLIPILLLAALILAFFVYTGDYYRADAQALAALESDGAAAVVRTSYGWFFDGPSEGTALIFYPGGKVEETAYAPFLHRLAAEGMDVCLVKMPFRLAVFGKNKADAVMSQHSCAHWYVGGHSLGGAMAASYAADHGDALDGVVLCAAYPTQALDGRLTEISIYGSRDGVLNMEKTAAGRAFAPDNFYELVIQGGNHAQFGNYGPQKGDGDAAVPSQQQQGDAVEFILRSIEP